jgi:endonuclease YncB( thermonuclease family)
MTLNRKVELAYGGEKRGRNEQAFAHVFAQSEGGRWIYVQQAMLLEGWARVRTHRENAARATLLYGAEDSARKAKKGLWADADYAVQSVETLAHTAAEAIAAHPECANQPEALAPSKAAAEQPKAEAKTKARLP